VYPGTPSAINDFDPDSIFIHIHGYLLFNVGERTK